MKALTLDQFAAQYKVDSDALEIMRELGMKPKVFEVGEKVTTSGFEGKIVRHYENNTWEVRLQSGLVAVSSNDIHPIA